MKNFSFNKSIEFHGSYFLVSMIEALIVAKN